MTKIITYGGVMIDVLNLNKKDIRIEDIAFGLSNIARFSGQVPFYSVARHSIHVASMLPDHLKLSGLLHDASEAYIGDLISPIKNMMKEYLEIEERLMNIISDKWSLKASDPLVSEADKMALEYEKSMLFNKKEHRTEDQKEIMGEFMQVYQLFKGKHA